MSFVQLAQAAQAREQFIEANSYYNTAEGASEGSFCAVVAEIETDAETGQIRVRKLHAAVDVGLVLNPPAHQGQIEGGIVQGIGYALFEELARQDGRLLTCNLGDYKLPDIKNTPPLKTILVKQPFGSGPFQAKDIGETSIIPVAAAISNAVYDAIGIRLTALPLSPEAVCKARADKRAAAIKAC